MTFTVAASARVEHQHPEAVCQATETGARLGPGAEAGGTMVGDE
jgi:hypothetical protein